MPFDRNKLENNAREITTAVERGDLLTAADVARITGLSRESIGMHVSRGKLASLEVGIDRYYWATDVLRNYGGDPNANGEGIRAMRKGTFPAWWAKNPRPMRGQYRGR